MADDRQNTYGILFHDFADRLRIAEAAGRAPYGETAQNDAVHRNPIQIFFIKAGNRNCSPVSRHRKCLPQRCLAARCLNDDVRTAAVCHLPNRRNGVRLTIVDNGIGADLLGAA